MCCVHYVQLLYLYLGVQVMEAEAEEDDMRPDDTKDIKPRFHQSKVVGGEDSQGSGEFPDDAGSLSLLHFFF